MNFPKLASCLALVSMLSVGWSPGATAFQAGTSSAARVSCDPDNGDILLPDGFCALVVADELGRARHLTVTDRGDVYVRFRERADKRGGVVALRDTDGDGRADVQEWFADHYGTGIELYNGHLYVSTDSSVLRYPLKEGQLEPAGEPEIVVDGLPIQESHAAKPLAFDDQGHLYVEVGAPSNACQEEDRTKGSPGMKPCPFLERQGGIWRFDADRVGQTQEKDGRRVLTGIRHAVAIAWNPENRSLYFVQHGRDQLHELYAEHFSAPDNAELPGEEFHRVVEGTDYGWPFCYWDPVQEQRFLMPEYGGDGEKVGDCEQHPRPLLSFPGHYGPNDLLFYTGDQFPERYRGGAFVAFHGSWNRAPLEQRGYSVAFVPMENGEPSGGWEVFADWFAGHRPLERPRDASHRPTGLAQGPDGSLYVSDSVQGRIWRVLHTGAR